MARISALRFVFLAALLAYAVASELTPTDRSLAHRLGFLPGVLNLAPLVGMGRYFPEASISTAIGSKGAGHGGRGEPLAGTPSGVPQVGGAGGRVLAATQPAASAGDAADSCCAQLNAIGFSSNLPVVIIRTEAASFVKEARVASSICTCSWGDANATDYSGSGKVKVRGNSSAKLAKKSYSIKLTAADGSGASAPILGMPAFDEWAMYATDSLDLTEGMRNYLAYGTFRQTGRWAARTRYAEAFVATAGEELSNDHYGGLYLVMEHNDRGKNRVDVKKWKEATPSGGYIFLYDNDNIDEGDLVTGVLPGFVSPFVVKYPTGNASGPAAASWLTEHLGQLQESILGEAWLDSEGGYATLLDSSSWIDFVLLTELSKNPDGYRGSNYFTKDVDKPFELGPPWDYNEAFGECCGFPIMGYDDGGASGPGIAGGSAISTAGWRFLICAEPDRCAFDPVDGISGWIRRLWNDTAFRVAAGERWAELRKDAWSDAHFESVFAEVTPLIADAVGRDLTKWETSMLKSWYATPSAQWESEVATLKTWLRDRVAWMDGALALARSDAYAYPGTSAAALAAYLPAGALPLEAAPAAEAPAATPAASAASAAEAPAATPTADAAPATPASSSSSASPLATLFGLVSTQSSP